MEVRGRRHRLGERRIDVLCRALRLFRLDSVLTGAANGGARRVVAPAGESLPVDALAAVGVNSVIVGGPTH